jgi:Fic family protein
MVADMTSPHSQDIPISHEMLGLVAEIDEFKGKWDFLKALSPERLRALRHVATIESIGSSTRIEGVRLSDREIETLLGNIQARSFRSRDEQEVAGYADAMRMVFESWEQLSLTENHIRQIHAVLLKYSDKDEHHRGRYKALPNNVVAYDGEGQEVGIVFETAAPFETSWEMERLLEWTNRELAEGGVHPLLAIGCFVVRFLAIHPFQDGNGRLSRVLTTALLLRAGYAYVPYASLESIIEENKRAYYGALRNTQMTLKAGQPDWNPWLNFFLNCLKMQKDNLSAKLEREKILARTLPTLSIRILSLLREHECLTISDLENLTAANRNTLKVRLRELTQLRYVSRHGRARATWYALNPAES